MYKERGTGRVTSDFTMTPLCSVLTWSKGEKGTGPPPQAIFTVSLTFMKAEPSRSKHLPPKASSTNTVTPGDSFEVNCQRVKP